MKKFVALLLIVVTLLTLSACGSKDALAGTWSAELGAYDHMDIQRKRQMHHGKCLYETGRYVHH